MIELTGRQKELIDELLKDFKGDTRDLFGEGGLLKTIGKRAVEAALSALDAFEAAWSEKYAAIAPLWRKDWARLAPFFDYPPAIRKAVYTTNAVESLNYSLRRIVKDKGAFPNDEAIFKLLWLGLQEASKKWKRPIRDWKAALNQFVILCGDRGPH